MRHRFRVIRTFLLPVCVLAALLPMPVNAPAANSGGTLDGNNYIGAPTTLPASGATVSIDSPVTNNVYGGKHDSANVTDNTVTMTGGSANWLLGGYSTSGDVSGNTVNVSGGTLRGGVSGGESGSGNARNNSVSFDTVTATYLQGGYSASGSATGNNVVMNGGTVQNNAFGGYVDSGSGAASSNTFTLNGGYVSGHVIGGQAINGEAMGNTVTINGGTVLFMVYGGKVDSGTGSATGNTVNVSGNPNLNDAMLYGGMCTLGSGDAFTGNVLNKNSDTTVDTAENFATVNFTYNGDANIKTLNSTPTGSSLPGVTVNTNDKTVAFGGVIKGSGSLIKIGTGTLTLKGANTYTGMTTVEAGTLKLDSGGALASSSGLTLYGGAAFDNSGGLHSLDGKQLNVNGANGRSATYMGDLSATNATLNFISPLNPSQPLLHVTGTTDVTGSAYNVGLDGGTSLATGSILTLLKSDGALTATGLHKGNGIIRIGSTVAHDITGSVTVDPVTGTITATVPHGRATQGAKALSEGFLGGMALNLQGADLVAGRGTEAAVHSAGSAGAGNGFAGFGALSGASMRYNTGSHVDMTSLSLLTGLARGLDLTPGRLTVGAFFEYGNGSYDTHNAFNNGSVKGDGDAYYLGGGILARLDFLNTGPGRFHAEASARAGKTHNEYDSSDLRDAQGRKAEYDSDTPYYGLHVGAGYLWEINDQTSLDLYGTYFWTRQEGDNLTLSTGEHLRFDDADSSRLRFGGRFAYAVNEHVAPYVGAAWEHEFDGKARATTNGFDIDAPSLHGDTGIGELGLSLTPSVDLPLTVDLGVQGYTGKREGVTGSMRIRFEF